MLASGGQGVNLTPQTSLQGMRLPSPAQTPQLSAVGMNQGSVQSGPSNVLLSRGPSPLASPALGAQAQSGTQSPVGPGGQSPTSQAQQNVSVSVMQQPGSGANSPMLPSPIMMNMNSATNLQMAQPGSVQMQSNQFGQGTLKLQPLTAQTPMTQLSQGGTQPGTPGTMQNLQGQGGQQLQFPGNNSGLGNNSSSGNLLNAMNVSGMTGSVISGSGIKSGSGSGSGANTQSTISVTPGNTMSAGVPRMAGGPTNVNMLAMQSGVNTNMQQQVVNVTPAQGPMPVPVMAGGPKQNQVNDLLAQVTGGTSMTGQNQNQSFQTNGNQNQNQVQSPASGTTGNITMNLTGITPEQQALINQVLAGNTSPNVQAQAAGSSNNAQPTQEAEQSSSSKAPAQNQAGGASSGSGFSMSNLAMNAKSPQRRPPLNTVNLGQGRAPGTPGGIPGIPGLGGGAMGSMGSGVSSLLSPRSGVANPQQNQIDALLSRVTQQGARGGG